MGGVVVSISGLGRQSALGGLAKKRRFMNGSVWCMVASMIARQRHRGAGAGMPPCAVVGARGACTMQMLSHCAHGMGWAWRVRARPTGPGDLYTLLRLRVQG